MLSFLNFCRSGLRAFKRRVAYANANYDRILFILFFPKLYFWQNDQIFLLSTLTNFKTWLGGEHHQFDVNMNFHRLVSLVPLKIYKRDNFLHQLHLLFPFSRRIFLSGMRSIHISYMSTEKQLKIFRGRHHPQSANSAHRQVTWKVCQIMFNAITRSLHVLDKLIW